MAVLQQDKMQLEEELSKAQKQNAHSMSDQQALASKYCDEIRQLEVDKVRDIKGIVNCVSVKCSQLLIVWE